MKLPHDKEGLVVLAFFVVVFGFIKVLLTPSLRSIRNMLASFVVGLPCGILAGLMALEWGVGQYTSVGIACVTTLIAENLLIAFLKNQDWIFDAIKGGIENLINKWTK